MIRGMAGVVVTTFLVVIGVAGAWLLNAEHLARTAVFAPKYEEVRRDTFEQSRAFNEGMAQELGNMYRDYQAATDEHKAALRAVVLHRTDGYDTASLPTYLAVWVGDLRTGVK